MKNNGREFEDLTEFVFRTLSGTDNRTRVERNVQLDSPEGTRQIDILIQSEVAGIVLTTIIECRDIGKRLDVTHIDALHSVLRDVKASKAVLVSRRGFSKQAIQKSNRLGITLCTLNNPESELMNLGRELPISLTEVTLEKLVLGFRLRTSQSTNINLGAGILVNDLDVESFIRKALLDHKIPIPQSTSAIDWKLPELGSKNFVRDANGTPMDITEFSAKLHLSIQHYFGYLSDLPAILLENLSQKRKDLIFKLEDILNYKPRLARFSSLEEIPKVHATVRLIGIAHPKKEKVEVSITNLETTKVSQFSLPVK